LSDAHKAADELSTLKTSPGQWLRNENSGELIENLITRNRLINPETIELVEQLLNTGNSRNNDSKPNHPESR
jgi:hypothetical protein